MYYTSTSIKRVLIIIMNQNCLEIMLQYESHSTQDIPDGPTDLTTDELSALFD